MDTLNHNNEQLQLKLLLDNVQSIVIYLYYYSNNYYRMTTCFRYTQLG